MSKERWCRGQRAGGRMGVKNRSKEEIKDAKEGENNVAWQFRLVQLADWWLTGAG